MLSGQENSNKHDPSPGYKLLRVKVPFVSYERSVWYLMKGDLKAYTLGNLVCL